MFSNNIFEAMYLFKALYVNHAISTFIKETPYVWQLLYLSFGFFLFKKVLGLRDTSNRNFHKPHSGVAGFAKYIIISFLALSLLGYTQKTSIYDYERYNWKESKLLQKETRGDADAKLQHYEVSVVLYLAMRLFSGIEHTFSSFIDKKFNPTEKYTTAPNDLYRTFFYAGYSQINDPKLRSKLHYFQEKCINPILPKIQNQKSLDQISDGSFLGESNSMKIRRLFSAQKAVGNMSCLSLRSELNRDIRQYLKIDSKKLQKHMNHHFTSHGVMSFSKTQADNFLISQALAKEIGQRNEDQLIENEAKLDGVAGFFQKLKAPFLQNMFFKGGSSASAKQSVQFSNLVKIMPHIKGFLLLIVIGFFPFLSFLMIFYGLKPLKIWAISFFLISMWVPIWAILYAVNISFTKNASLITQLQGFADGISVYTANSINEHIQRSYSSFFIGQAAVVLATLIGITKQFGPATSPESANDDAPQEVKSGAATGAKFTSGGML